MEGEMIGALNHGGNTANMLGSLLHGQDTTKIGTSKETCAFLSCCCRYFLNIDHLITHRAWELIKLMK